MLSNTQQMICMSFHIVLVFIQFIAPSTSWLEFSAFVCHSRCTNIIRILILCICLFLYLSECYLGYVWLHHHHQHTYWNSFVFVYNFCSYFLLWSQSSSLYILLFELIVFFPNSYIFFIPIIIVTFRMCVVIVVESSWYLAKPSSPSTSVKFFCICLAFSYFLLSLRSFWYHPLFLFRCISSSISTWS